MGTIYNACIKGNDMFQKNMQQPWLIDYDLWVSWRGYQQKGIYLQQREVDIKNGCHAFR